MNQFGRVAAYLSSFIGVCVQRTVLNVQILHRAWVQTGPGNEAF